MAFNKLLPTKAAAIASCKMENEWQVSQSCEGDDKKEP